MCPREDGMRTLFGVRSANREQRVRLVVALAFILVILTFYVWFVATHLQRTN
jgi:hypothetical protein